MTTASCPIPMQHEDGGSSDTSTIVVLQGTGISYPSVDCRKRFERISDNQIEKAKKWSKTKEKTFQLHLPQRMSDDPPATTEQIATIGGLVRSIAGSVMPNLGSEQAAFLIHELKTLQDLFSEIKIHEYLDRQRTTGRLSLILFMAIIGYALVWACH